MTYSKCCNYMINDFKSRGHRSYRLHNTQYREWLKFRILAGLRYNIKMGPFGLFKVGLHEVFIHS